jgi:CHAD domain-containing protein
MPIAKWFPELTRATPLRVAARTVLQARAAGVEHYLQQIKRTTGPDSEDVHQLRVATRRLATALSIFKSCLDRRTRRRLRRETRTLRRAAGAVRDWDVQQSLLKERFNDAERLPANVVQNLRRKRQTQRRSLQKALMQSIHRCTVPFQKSVAATLASLDAHDLETNRRVVKLASTARATLRKRLKQLLAASRRDLDDLDNLHRLRIVAKRLRYAMEVFAACYLRRFQNELYTEVERLQEVLGDINDLRNLNTRLEQWDAEAKLRLSRDVARDLATRQTQLLRWWTRRRQARFNNRFVTVTGVLSDILYANDS